MTYYMEARTVYGRTVYCVMCVPSEYQPAYTKARCDSQEDALSIIAALAAQTAKVAR